MSPGGGQSGRPCSDRGLELDVEAEPEAAVGGEGSGAGRGAGPAYREGLRLGEGAGLSVWAKVARAG